jgi:CBS domain containing-hemolysin-like protein
MDDPFGPSIVIFIALLLAVIVRMAEAAVPFIDEGETQKKADTGDAKARRALKLALKAESPSANSR